MQSLHLAAVAVIQAAVQAPKVLHQAAVSLLAKQVQVSHPEVQVRKKAAVHNQLHSQILLSQAVLVTIHLLHLVKQAVVLLNQVQGQLVHQVPITILVDLFQIVMLLILLVIIITIIVAADGIISGATIGFIEC